MPLQIQVLSYGEQAYCQSVQGIIEAYGEHLVLLVALTQYIRNDKSGICRALLKFGSEVYLCAIHVLEYGGSEYKDAFIQAVNAWNKQYPSYAQEVSGDNTETNFEN